MNGATLPHGGEPVTFVPHTKADGKLAAKEVAILSTSRTPSESHDPEMAEIEKIMREEERGWPEYETSVTTEPHKNGVWVVLGFGVLGFYISKWLLDSYFYIVFWTVMATGVGLSVAKFMAVTKTTNREITSTCLKCGGEGRVTQ